MHPDFIFISRGSGLKKIAISSLLCIKQGDGYSQFVTRKGTYYTSATLQQIERCLSHQGFCQVNDQCLVALSKIICFDRHTVELPGLRIPLQKKFMPLLKDAIKIIDGAGDPSKFQALAVDEKGKLCHRIVR